MLLSQGIRAVTYAPDGAVNIDPRWGDSSFRATRRPIINSQSLRRRLDLQMPLPSGLINRSVKKSTNAFTLGTK